MTLREELARIPGVINADIDLRDGEPTAIRIHSGEGADQRAIGEAVQHALRRHGLRSRVAPPRATVEPPSAPAPPHLSLMPAVRAAGPPVESAPPETRRIVSVGARDDGRRTVVTVTDNTGREAEGTGRRTRADRIAACVRAVAELFDADCETPQLVAVRSWEHESARVITVIVDVDGTTRVGSAIDDGLELRAVALAVWQALSA